MIGKVEEELIELREALAGVPDPMAQGAVAEEFGDLLFTVANLGRYLRVDPETALAAANRKFERRFRGVETKLAASGRSPRQSTLEEMDALWTAVKRDERGV